MMSATIPETIVVVGFGWVGQANALALVRMGYPVYFYDVVTPPRHYVKEYGALYEKIKLLSGLRAADSPDTWYIVCIGDRVSPEGVQDITFITRALEELRGVAGKVILRSTVLPSSLASLPFDLYVPEFLHELKAVEECLNPYFFVLGERRSLPLPGFLKEWEARSYKQFRGTPEEAAHLKYLSNVWNAVRVAFVNEFGDSLGLPVSAAAREANERILDFVLERGSYLRYGQGYGGHCLPKDMRAYAAAKRSIRPVPLLDGAQEANARHEAVVNQYATLPQWFSFWEYRGQWQPRWWWSGWWRKFNNRQLVRRLRHWLRPLRRSAEQIKPPPTLPELKAKWEALARENAFYYAHPDTPGGEKVDEFELRESGRADVAAHLTGDPRWGERAAALSGGVALEIGAGVGRLTEHLAPLFKQLHAVDISPEMLAVARRRLGAQSTVQWAETSGGELPFADATFDFIFSAETFKHFPARELIARYLSEIYRVLKSGGTAKLELRTGAEVYRSRWFHGVALSPAEARALAEQAGLRVLDIKIATPKSMWLWVEKQRIS